MRLIKDRYVLRELYKHGRSPNWYAQVRDLRTGRTHTFSCRSPSKGKAESFALRWIDDHFEGVRPLRAAPFTPLYRAWIELKHIRAVTRRDYLYRLTGVLEPWFGNAQVADITRVEVQRFLREYEIATGAKPGTLRNYLTHLRGFFTWAADEGYTDRDPTRGLTVPRGQTVVPRALTVEAARRLVRAADGWLRVACLLALLAGLRRRNVLGIRWSWIDLDEQTATFAPDEMKSRRQHVAVLNDELVEVLRAYRHSRPDGDPLFPQVRLWNVWGPFRRRAGFEGLRFHDLRHTFATWLASTASYATLQAALGHRGGSVTDQYLHVPAQEVLAAVRRLPRITDLVADPD